MSKWTNLARRDFSERVGGAADKTAETPLLSVLAVGVPPVPEKHSELLTVSSVPTPGIYEKQGLSIRLIEAALRACDHWEDGPAARQQMVDDCNQTPDHLKAELLAYFQTQYGGTQP